MNKIKITPISEIEADKRRLCEIRFDCYVTMHDSGIRDKGTPQWFKSQSQITLEEIKHQSHELLGLRLKQMLFELEQAIEKYEQRN
tara:strand:- start:629 stop:886 length:258 start_codon:yes stop_codon:yes gene_type:complete